MILFINVIEVAPFNFSKSAWQILQKLPTIRDNSYLVNINDCDDKALKIILKNHLKEMEDLEDVDTHEDIFYALYGGIAIKIDNQIVLEAQCCSDLTLIEEWKNTFDKINPNWQTLWVGHPWVFVRLIDGFVEFSDYTEKNVDDFKRIEPKFRLPQSILAKAIEKIENELVVFEKRLLSLIRNGE